MALVLDTGVLYAVLDSSDPDHESCVDLLGTNQEPLVIPAPVLVELDYWVRKFASADVWVAFCEDVHGGGYAIYPLDAALLLQAGQIQSKYADLPLNLVDAVVFSTCELLGEEKVGTLDRRHFGVLRKQDGSTLRILPDGRSLAS